MKKCILISLFASICVISFIAIFYYCAYLIKNNNDNNNSINEMEYYILFPNKKHLPISNSFIQSSISNRVSYDYNINITSANITQDISNDKSWYGTFTDSFNVVYKCKIMDGDKFIIVTFKPIHPIDKYQQGYFDACKDFYEGKLKVEPIKDNSDKLSFKWIK